MVLGLVAVALGAAYLTSMPRSSAQELIETASSEAQGLVQFLVSRFSGRSLALPTAARRVDPATKRMSRVLLLVAGVGVVVVGQKLYNRYVRASRIAGATVVVTGASQVRVCAHVALVAGSKPRKPTATTRGFRPCSPLRRYTGYWSGRGIGAGGKVSCWACASSRTCSPLTLTRAVPQGCQAGCAGGSFARQAEAGVRRD